MHANVHSSTVYKSRNTEANQVSNNRQTDKEDVNEGNPAICNNIGGLGERQVLVTYMWNTFTLQCHYMWNLKPAITSDYNEKAADTENETVVPSEDRNGEGRHRGGGLGGTERYAQNELQRRIVQHRNTPRILQEL